MNEHIDTPDTLELLGDGPPPVRAHTRRNAAWLAACYRLGYDLSADNETVTRYHRFYYYGIGGWMASRASGVALTVADPERQSFWVGAQRRDNARRDLMTFEVCMVVASAIVNTLDWDTERRHIAMGSSERHIRAATDDCFPGYVFIRNYLHNEAGAAYVLACRVAMLMAYGNARLTALYHERTGTPWRIGRERGWL